MKNLRPSSPFRAALPAALAVLFVAAPAARAADAPPTLDFAIAKLLESEGDNAAAAREYQRSLDALTSAGRDDAYLRAEYAEFLLRSGHPVEAHEQAKRAVELAPADVDVLRVAGQVELARADMDPRAVSAAEEAFQRIRKADPRDVRAMVTLAQIYLTQGKAKEAVDVLEEVARYRPQHPMVTSYLVDALVKSGETAKAQKVLSDALAANPDAVETRLALADLQGRAGDHAAAVATLSAVPEGEGTPELRRKLAAEQFRAGQPAAALATVDAEIAAGGDDPGLRYLRALALLSLGRADEAAEDASKLMTTAPDNVDLNRLMAEILERQGKHDQAAALLERLVRTLQAAPGADPDDVAHVQLLHGVALMRAERPADAVTAVAPLLDSKDAETRDDALELTVEALVAQHREADALAELDRRAGDSPSPALAARRGELLLRLKRDDEAKSVLDALAARPEPEAVLAAASVYQRLDRGDDAIRLLQGFVARHPDAVRVSFNLAAALEQNGQREAAVATFRDLLQREPDFAPALNYLGYMWADANENLGEARDLLERAVKLDPTNGAYIDSLGWAYYRLGEIAAARSQLEQAVKLVPDDATLLEHLGDVYVAAGEKTLAKDAYQRAAALADENEAQVRRKLEKLR